MGASRGAVFLQRLVESELVGALGGVLGLVLALLGLRVLDAALPDTVMAGGLFTLSSFMLGAAVLLSLIAGLLAGVYPAWRACRIAPAMQLKLQ